jgi:hypothetical protein
MLTPHTPDPSNATSDGIVVMSRQSPVTMHNGIVNGQSRSADQGRTCEHAIAYHLILPAEINMIRPSLLTLGERSGFPLGDKAYERRQGNLCTFPSDKHAVTGTRHTLNLFLRTICTHPYRPSRHNPFSILSSQWWAGASLCASRAMAPAQPLRTRCWVRGFPFDERIRPDNGAISRDGIRMPSMAKKGVQ